MSKDGLPWEVDFQLALCQRAADRADALPGVPGNDDAGIAVADVPAWYQSPARGRRHAEGTGHYDCADRGWSRTAANVYSLSTDGYGRTIEEMDELMMVLPIRIDDFGGAK